MNTSSTTLSLAFAPGSACTRYAWSDVNLTVHSKGTIVVQALVWVYIHHTQGTLDRATVLVANATTSCYSLAGAWPYTVGAAEENATYSMGTYPQAAFPVTAGTYTFAVTGYITSSSAFLSGYETATLVAVFYPS